MTAPTVTATITTGTPRTGRRTTRAAQPNGDWRDQAACRDHDPELFFPLGSTPSARTQEAHARQVCGRCPSRTACLTWALSTGQEAGVWGGLSEQDRRQLLSKRADADIEDVSPTDVAEAQRLATERGTDLLVWKREGLDLSVISKRLARERRSRSHPEPPTVAVIRVTYRLLGDPLLPVAPRSPLRDRVLAQWGSVETLQAEGVSRRQIAKRLGVSVDVLRTAIRAVESGNVDPAEFVGRSVSAQVAS